MAQENGDEGFHMWEYWYERKGIERALEEYFPATLKNDQTIASAYQQLKNAERVIKQRMQELEQENDD